SFIPAATARQRIPTTRPRRSLSAPVVARSWIEPFGIAERMAAVDHDGGLSRFIPAHELSIVDRFGGVCDHAHHRLLGIAGDRPGGAAGKGARNPRAQP